MHRRNVQYPGLHLAFLVQPALGSVAPDLDGRIKRHLDPATLTKICKLEPAVYEALKK